jgi:hypothetical protein
MDIHSVPGLDFFADMGVQLSIVPHWNNTDGGADVDTSRCFLGMDRFTEWCSGLPSGHTVLGLDEHTGIIMDFSKRDCQVMGVSSVSLLRTCEANIYPSGTTFPLSAIGPLQEPLSPSQGISTAAWELAANTPELETTNTETPPPAVLALAEARQAARARKDWGTSDDLRHQITAEGWSVQDTPQGWNLVRL